MKRKSEKMGTVPVWRLLLSFSGPAIISMTVWASYNLVDAIFVGRLGAEALAAITVAFPITLAFAAVATGTGIGAVSLVSRRLGAKDNEGADKVASVTVSLTFLFMGIQLIARSFFQALGKGLSAVVVSNSRQFIFLLPLLIFLPKILGITGLWVAFPISDILALLFSVLWLVMELRKQGIPVLFSAGRNSLKKAD